MGDRHYFHRDADDLVQFAQSLYYLRLSKCRNTTRKSAQSGHSNSASFHCRRLRRAAKVVFAMSMASSSLSSGSSSLSSSSSSMMSLASDSSTSPSKRFFSSSAAPSSCGQSVCF